MKKIFVFALASLLALSACSKKQDTETTDAQPAVDVQEQLPEGAPFKEFPKQFEISTTIAMSNFMPSGRYIADGNTVYGQAFDTSGKPEFVRFDLEQKGDFWEVVSHKVIEKEIQATYISIFDDYVFYIRAGKDLYCVNKDGSNPRRIIENASAYLQIIDNKMYWADSSYNFKSAKLSDILAVANGKKDSLDKDITTVVDKEIYYPFMLNKEWLLFQDDADHEALHLRHIPSKQEATLTQTPAHGPVIYGSDIFFKTEKDGVKTLAKLDLNTTKIDYNAEKKAYFSDFSSIEYSGKAFSGQIAIDTNGLSYAGLSQNIKISRWKEIDAPESSIENAYEYFGKDFTIYWEIDQKGVVKAIKVQGKDVVSGIQAIPRMD